MISPASPFISAFGYRVSDLAQAKVCKASADAAFTRAVFPPPPPPPQQR
jgi:hypothetical protein